MSNKRVARTARRPEPSRPPLDALQVAARAVGVIDNISDVLQSLADMAEDDGIRRTEDFGVVSRFVVRLAGSQLRRQVDDIERALGAVPEAS